MLPCGVDDTMNMRNPSVNDPSNPKPEAPIVGLLYTVT